MIGIIGAGTMGKGIAIEFARFGHKVVLVSYQRHLSKEHLHVEVEKVTSKFDYENKEAILNNIETTNEFSGLIDCSLIIEAVSENLEIKRKAMFDALPFINKTAIISSNTSSLSIEDIFNGIFTLDRIMGLHFFNPVQVMKLVELSYLEESNKDDIEKARQLVCSIGKEVVLVKNTPGFIVNRLLIPLINEASKIVEEGIASIEDVDRAMKFGANHPMGPLKLSDLIGNDVILAIMETLKKENPNHQISELLKSKVSNNELGRKTQAGFYKYEKK